MQRTELELQARPGGWVDVTISQDGEFWDVHLRLRRTDDGWEPQGTLYARRLSPQTLKAIPLRRILAAVAASDALRNDLEKQFEEPAPEPGSDELKKWPRPQPGLTLSRCPPSSGRGGAGSRTTSTPPSQICTARPPPWAESTHGCRRAGRNVDRSRRPLVREARKRGQLPPTAPGKAKA